MEWTSLHKLLVAGDVDLVARKPTSLWSNRLVLPGIDAIDHAKFDSEEKIEASPETVSLRGRRLERAVLIDSNLRKADLTAARLQGAVLVRADLREAELSCASPIEGPTRPAQDCAQLQGADLQWAKLQGANLRDAQLQGANLIGAELQGANLLGAELQGADLRGARLMDANLGYALLQGANLRSARLMGADFGGARLQGANLRDALLQGANLLGAELQGARLQTAQLQGADLRGAQLQGANLIGAQLQGADLGKAGLWLASFPADLVTQSPVPLGVADLYMSPLTTKDKANLAGTLQADITDGELLKELLDRLNPIPRYDPPKWTDEANWSRYVSQTKEPSPDELVQFLVGIACEEPGGHIANGIADRAFRSQHNGHYAKPLAMLPFSPSSTPAWPNAPLATQASCRW